MKILILSFYLAVTGFTFSAKIHEEWICSEQKYTYQIQVINSRDKVALPTTICTELENHRKQSEDSYYSYSRLVRLHIFSKDKIAKGLQPIDQIVYITE